MITNFCLYVTRKEEKQKGGKTVRRHRGEPEISVTQFMNYRLIVRSSNASMFQF